ncbi:MAG: DUF1579 family protein [Chthonomonas sp.]|nr:DUF1579 family protein [Chthonomonas sp.]
MFAVSLVLSTIMAVAQPAPDPAKDFDFWIGEWKCAGDSYDAAGKATKTEATNRIAKILDSKVVEENFKMGSFIGRSYSTYDPTAKLWRQTWVDNQGSYIALTGKFEAGKMILQTIPNPLQPKVASRMVFENIKKESFDWNWESSTDEGKTWKLNWHLRYTRVK